MENNKTNKKKINREKIFVAIRIIISLSLFSFLILRNLTNLRNFFSTIHTYNFLYLITAFLLFASGIYIQMLRWDILLKAKGIYIHKGFLFRTYYIGFFYSNIFPTNIGGDIYRAYDLHNNKNIELHKNISVIIMERFISIASASIFVLASFFILYKYLNIQIIIGLILVPLIILLVFLIILNPEKFRLNRFFKRHPGLNNFKSRLDEFRECFLEFKNKKSYVVLSFIVCFISQLFFISCYYFSNLYAKVNLDFYTFLFINPIITLSANIPITIGGIGVRENTAVLVLKKFGIAESYAVIFAMAVLTIILVNAIIGGVLYIIKNIFYKNKGIL